MAEEEEVLFEVEAVEAVYGDDDCRVIQRFPPHLTVHIKPRTADDSSQQFVEAVLGLQAGPQYPKELPHIYIVESKGLDEKRKAHLLNSIREKAHELSSCLMLVALFEEAVETLSNMNHPDGSCPLCLYPLVKDDMEGNFLPFMKLMSCFHCFHSECIIRWWTWLQEQNKTNQKASVSRKQSRKAASSDLHGTMNTSLGLCPVCRMVFHTKDIEHVLNLVGTHSAQQFVGTETEDDGELLQSEAEIARRQKFESVLKLQEENSGLIEPKKLEVLRPGMFLPEPVSLPTESTKSTAELQQTDPISSATTSSETSSSRLSNKPDTSERENSGMRPKYRARHPREQKHSGSTKPVAELQQTDPISTPTTSEAGFSRSWNNPVTSEHKNSGMRPNNRVRHPREQKPTESTKPIIELQQIDQVSTPTTSETGSSRSSNKPGNSEHKNLGTRPNNRVRPQQTDPVSTPTTSETGSSRSWNKLGTSEHKNLSMRPQNRVREPREQKKKWIEKEIRD